MTTRNGATDAYHTRHTDFIGDIWVKCPNCSKKAVVKTPGYPQQNWSVYDDEVRFSCMHCVKALFLKDVPKPVLFYNSRGKAVTSRVIYGDNRKTDIFFGYELWLIEECMQDFIWAYNDEHLQFLEEFIAAPLRSKPHNMEMFSNKSIGSRLPRWMTSAKNREKVLKAINSLKNKSQ